ncbi:MAG TPA: polysaccharide biosynthesis C-terminal domain-containing protein [Flavobacteriaceae bacterium]|nr:polysaccharide biosynthesis C-terminal domain-containing protein [Flavobacteriaceae bacterium]
MGIVLKQSFLNTLILFLGFAIGGINVLFLYTHFLDEDYFGLITFLLSTANILLPLVVFGMQHTVIKFFSSYATKIEQDRFLTASLILPLFIIIPLAFVGILAYENIANWLAKENPLIKNYTYLIFLIAIFMGYFEVFYAWSKVKFQSVFGNFIREIFARVCVSILLIAVYFNYLTNQEFIYAVVVVYALRTLIMKLYAFWIYTPKITLKIPSNIKQITSFSLYIIVAGSAAGILLEIDKFMIPQMEQLAEVAYYSVGIYIASVVAIPTRAMQQITNPITAHELSKNNIAEVENLYKETSINLLLVGGLLFLLINLNVEDLYELINKPEYTKGIIVVLIISTAKLVELALGTGNAILINSKYYKIFFYLSVAMAVSVIVLNHWLIGMLGIKGAAIATLIVVFSYSFIKIIYIKSKLNIQPFSKKTLHIILIILILYIFIYALPFAFTPIVNIVVKSIIIATVYIAIVKYFKISDALEKQIIYFKRKK